MTAMTSTIFSANFLHDPSSPSLSPMASTAMLTSSTSDNNTHHLMMSSSDESSDSSSVDDFLRSLSLSSLQYLNKLCTRPSHLLTNQSHQFVHSHDQSSSTFDHAEHSAEVAKSKIAWPTNNELLCDRFFQNFANLTNDALNFLSFGVQNEDELFASPASSLVESTSLWSSSSAAAAGTFTDGSNVGYSDEDDTYLSPNLRILLTVFLSLMIVSTVIGNILVCLSVILVRKLRHPSNYLLVSLAISDLCVAILVMPLALQYELTRSWNLSHAICDLWVSFDVTCCTSSILNLCTISIDRYLAITKPLTYGVRRTTKRILSFIACVWVASCLISIPPVLMLGNEHGTLSAPTCEVSQNLAYQLYATLAAFYIPLAVMIFMYYKIYVAAKRVVDAELRDQRPSCSSATSQCVSLLKSCGNSVNSTSDVHLHQTNLYPNFQYSATATSTNYSTSCKLYPSEQSDTGSDHQANHANCVNINNNPISPTCKSKKSKKKSKSREQRKVQRMLNVINRDRKDSKCSSSSAKSNRNSCSCCCPCLAGSSKSGSAASVITTEPNNNNILNLSNARSVNGGTSHMLSSSTTPPILVRHHTHHMSNNMHNNNQIRLNKKLSFSRSFSSERASIANVNYKRRASNALRERKASFTLGIIMTAFTVCWLPFFILALLRPFSSSIVQIPRFVNSVALWLGYANSMLNPIIYVTFHQDFRRAFKYLLCLQCSTMGSRLRAEAYISQYGGSLGHLNNAANNATNGKKNAQMLRANASWSQLDSKAKDLNGSNGKSAQFQATGNNLQSSSTIPLLSGQTGSTNGEAVGSKEYELQSMVTTNGTAALGPNGTVVGGGIPVSLLVTTTFALTNTTTTTSARIAQNGSSMETEFPTGIGATVETSINGSVPEFHHNGDLLPGGGGGGGGGDGDGDSSLGDTNSYSTNGGYVVENLSIQIDPINHEATITRNTVL